MVTNVEDLPVSEIITLLNRYLVTPKTVLESPTVLQKIEKYDSYVFMHFVEKLGIHIDCKKDLIEKDLSPAGKETLKEFIFRYKNLKETTRF